MLRTKFATQLNAAVCRRQSGYLLIELMAVVFVLVTLLGGILLNCEACKEFYYRRQVYLAANQLSGDLRRLQQCSVYDDYTAQALKTADAEGYIIIKNTKVLKEHCFRDNGCEGVYFYSRLYNASFGMDGAPSVSGKYILSHRKMPTCRYIVEIQPITGRILVSERK